MFGDCVFPYLFIDASTEEYEEGEEAYEEEEEHPVPTVPIKSTEDLAASDRRLWCE